MAIQIKVSEIKEFLKNGVTRTTADKHYNPNIGSLEEKYGVSADDIKQLFRNPVLKGLKVTPYREPVFSLIDDTIEVTEEDVQSQSHITDAFNTSDVEENATESVEEVAPSVETPTTGGIINAIDSL